MDREFVPRDCRELSLKEIDKESKNKFRWNWLEEKDGNGDFLSDYMRKLKKCGFCWCTLCETDINYAQSGKKALVSHTKAKSHIRKRTIQKTCPVLPTMFKKTQSLIDGSASAPMALTVPEKAVPYGTPANVISAIGSSSSSKAETVAAPQKHPVNLSDRISHQEALVCSFIAEHSLPLSITPHLVALASELSRDPEALSKVSLTRKSATYKLRDGLHVLNHKRLVDQMKSSTFSINLDESTSKANKKRILNVLVCFFDQELGKSVTHVYGTIELSIVNAQTVFDAVISKFRSDCVPLDNLVSVLCDSAAYMRGINNGFEKKLKDEAPHLLDIDGDVCHHIHNIVKKCCDGIDESTHLGKLLDDIHRDFSFSADLREDLKAISVQLKVDPVLPVERVEHRWLSMLDSSLRFIQLLAPLTIFYSAWLSVKDRPIFGSIAATVLDKQDSSSKAQLLSILSRLKAKGLTNLGRARKQRIVAKLFNLRKKTLLLSHTFCAVLPPFKKFVLKFQQSAPRVHQLHDELLNLFKLFLTNYVRPEHLQTSKIMALTLDGTDDGIFLLLKDVFCGDAAQKVLTRMQLHEQTGFRLNLLKAFKTTGSYMKKKLPISNSVLRHLSAIDPIVQGHAATTKCLLALKGHFHFLSEEEIQLYDEEVKAYSVSSSLPPSDGLDLDTWWAKVIPLFPTLGRIMKACLSIFTGPRVEQSFSFMNDIMDCRSNRLNITTYEAYLATKYWLMAKGKSSIQAFHRPCKVYTAVDPALVYHIKTAWNKDRKRSHGACAGEDDSPLPQPKRPCVM